MNEVEATPLLCRKRTQNLVRRKSLSAKLRFAAKQDLVQHLKGVAELHDKAGSREKFARHRRRGDMVWCTRPSRKPAQAENRDSCHALSQRRPCESRSSFVEPLLEDFAGADVCKQKVFDNLARIPTFLITVSMPLDFFYRETRKLAGEISVEVCE